MELKENWLTNGRIDFEFKKYQLLAYLQSVSKKFDKQMLYPILADLIEHYKRIVAFKKKKEIFDKNLPGTIKAIDLQKMTFDIDKSYLQLKSLSELEYIINYSIPKFKESIATGKELYDEIEQMLNIFPIGIVPLNVNYGYLMLRNAGKKTSVYEYQVTVFERDDEKFRGIHTTFVQDYQYNFANTYETIKYSLIKENRVLPNPAVYVAETDTSLPITETMLPVAKRSLIQLIANNF